MSARPSWCSALSFAPVALVALLAACSGGAGSSSGEEPTHIRDLQEDASGDAEEAGAETEVEDSDLADALLTEQDLPYGFTPAENVGRNEDDQPMCEAGGHMLDISEVDVAQTAFGNDEGLTVIHALERHEPGNAALELEAMRQESAACNGQPGLDGPPLSVEPIMFPTLGDDTTAFRITQAEGDVRVTLDVVGFQNGDLVSFVVAGGPCDCPPELLVELATVAEQRAAELAGQPG